MTAEISIAALITRYRWALLLLSMLVLLISIIGLQQVKLTGDIRTMMAADHPALMAIDQMSEDFDVPRSFVVFVTTKQDQLNRDNLALIDQLALSFETGPAVTSVRSLANSSYLYAEQDDLFANYLYDRDLPDANSAARYATIRDWLVQEPTLAESFISADARMSAIVVNTWLEGDTNYNEIVKTRSFIFEKTSKFLQQNPQYRIDVSGELALAAVGDESLYHDLRVNLSLAMLFIFLILLVQFRSPLSASFIFSVSIFACISALGAAGFAQIYINNINLTAPIIIVVIGVLDGIHLFSIYQKKIVEMEPIEALRATIEIAFKPITLTTLTTASGFLALNLSSSPAISSLGNIAAIGIVMAWFYTFALLSSLIVFTRRRAAPPPLDWIDASLSKMGQIVIKYPKQIILVFGLLFVVTLMQIPNIIIDDDKFNQFDSSLPYVKSQQFVRDKMASGAFSVFIDSGRERGIHDATLLADVDSLAQWIKQQDGVVNAFSYVDHIKRINQLMNGSDSQFYRVPDDNALVAQYGLLYNLSIPSPDELTRYTDITEQKLLLTVMTDDISRGELNVLVGGIESKIELLGLNDRANVTGWMVAMDAEVMVWVKELLKGFAIAFLVISLQMFIYLRSFKMGVICVVPNLLPIAIVFGAWGLLGVPLDFITLLTLSVSFGIVVDDTIHFMSKYLDHLRKHHNSVAAVQYAYRFSGRAIVITTLVLTLGASPMLFTWFIPMQSIVTLIAPIVFMALLIDLLLLPALLLVTSRHSDKNQSDLSY